jgi:folate-binding protein YgfZ
MSGELDAALRRRGAVIGDAHGVAVPAHFGDPVREWRAAREGAAVFAATYRSLLAATGDDRVAFLQGMLSNDVKALAAGMGTYASLLTQQGRVVTDLRVFAETERLLLDVLGWRRDALRAALEQFIVADDVELTVPEDTPLIGMLGPLAAAVAGEALGSTDLPRAAYAHMRSAYAGSPVLVLAVREVGVEALLFCGRPATAAPLFDACVEAGAQPLGMAALDVIRVERGVPWAGVDMDESTLLMETGCEAAISFTKGCYLGQEVVERVAARGQVTRHLAGVLLDGQDLPGARSRLLAGGREVGYVTSAVRSPALDRAIALAMVQRKHVAPGDRVEIETGGSGTVTALPFVPAAND